MSIKTWIIISTVLIVIVPITVWIAVDRNQQKTEQETGTEKVQTVIKKAETSNPEPKPAKTIARPVPIATGKITTIADGYDVGKVNLWSSTNASTRRIVKSLRNGDKVIVWKYAEPYYQVESASKDGIKGYFMKGFVIFDR